MVPKLRFRPLSGQGTGAKLRSFSPTKAMAYRRQHASEIFKPFFTTKSSGTGLGLSNAHRIIEAHGGRIDVDNRPIPGAFFKIILPVEKTG